MGYVIEDGWTFVSHPQDHPKGYACHYCPVVTKTHKDGSVSLGQFFGSIATECPHHGIRECKGGCGEVVGDSGLAHYVSAVGHFSDPEDAITPYYTCALAKEEA